MGGFRKRHAAAAVALAAMGLGTAPPALAHHSFAVFFDPQKMVTITGTVTAFRFTNPHGTIALDVKKPDGSVEKWRVETNAPVVLTRRGWTRQSLKPGDVVTIEGWAARDGKPYLRLRMARDAQGKPIGQTAFGITDE
ncbi:conserved hypothetical protein [Altererythrobacter sp. B11]|uniref:DUF6152 family protein n=1 Tax=Altererythrobacter sp. B11 TaxID=2060312 RepID=UPI000DC72D03|nr:DUF6152 family protein [Altererythrobacter sp. B11]BBC72122.1 conserved hypothetical protein [Altererythrobacter sp. B11]